jgi:C1A family cysteine protease
MAFHARLDLMSMIQFEHVNWKDFSFIGDAVVAVACEEKIPIKNEMCDKVTKGALQIRISRGIEWGDKGYRYLPYRFILEGLAEEWSTLIE